MNTEKEPRRVIRVMIDILANALGVIALGLVFGFAVLVVVTAFGMGGGKK